MATELTERHEDLIADPDAIRREFVRDLQRLARRWDGRFEGERLPLSPDQEGWAGDVEEALRGVLSLTYEADGPEETELARDVGHQLERIKEAFSEMHAAMVALQGISRDLENLGEHLD